MKSREWISGEHVSPEPARIEEVASSSQALHAQAAGAQFERVLGASCTPWHPGSGMLERGLLVVTTVAQAQARAIGERFDRGVFTLDGDTPGETFAPVARRGRFSMVSNGDRAALGLSRHARFASAHELLDRGAMTSTHTIYPLASCVLIAACAGSAGSYSSTPDEAYGPAAPAPAVSVLMQPGPAAGSPYASVNEPDFDTSMKKMTADREMVMKRQLDLLAERYDLSDHAHATARMTRGKGVQTGVRVKLHGGVTWNKLNAMSPAEIRDKELFPKGFLPLPHPNHPQGGMVFPKFHIEDVLKQTKRDLTRFDLDFDLPDVFLPEFPPAIFLTTRLDLGDVSKGELVTHQNFYRLFKGILNPKQLDGLRLLVTPTPQQQFNLTDDRRSAEPSLGVTCFDCHSNGHTNAATHLVGDIRPQELRHRIDTPSLRGVNIQRLFGSQRALKSVEDFSEFEQRAAYFDGDPVIATKKGVNVLERGSEVHNMAEFQEILDFPPAPKLDVLGRLDPAKATPEELRGQAVFFGKGRCGECHTPPYYTDNSMHNLRAERFYKPQEINGRLAMADGPIKTFVLRGIKETPPYLHDGRLLTLADTVEFFNLILGLRLSDQEKADLEAFMLAL